MNRAKPTIMLGLEVGADELRLVRIRVQTSGPVLDRAVVIPCAPTAAPEAVAASLRRALDAQHLSTSTVALCLPPGAGFLQCEPAAAASLATPPAGAVHGGTSGGASGSASGGDFLEVAAAPSRRAPGLLLRAFVQRPQAERALAIAAHAGLTVATLELPQIAAAAALGLAAQPDAPPHAGLLLSGGSLFYALADGDALLACSSEPVGVIAGDGSPDPDPDSLADAAARVHRLAQWRFPDHPCTAVRLIAPAPAAADTPADAAAPAASPLATELADRLRLPVTPALPGADCSLVALDPPADPGAFARPIGAALIALGLSPRRTALLDELQREAQPRFALDRRRVAFLAALAVLIFLGLLGPELWFVFQQQRALATLDQIYQQAAPRIAAQDVQRQTSRLFGPWFGASHGGRRIAEAQILSALNGLFPDPEVAYVTAATIDATDPTKPVRITLNGRAKSSDVLYQYIARLEQSGQFDKVQMGAVTEDEAGADYPKRYSLTMVYKGLS